MTGQERSRSAVSNASGENRGSQRSAAGVIFCLSLANLLLLHISFGLNSPHFIGFRKTPLDPATQLRGLAAGLIAVGCVAAVFWVALRLLRANGTRGAQLAGNAGVLFVLAIAANTWRVSKDLTLPGNTASLLSPGAMALLAIGGLAGVFAFYRWRNLITRAAFAAVMCLSPLLAITTATALFKALRPAPASAMADGPVAPAIPPTNRAGRQRVVWMIFDELDQRLLFGARPAGISLPEFDALRRQAFHGEAAERPAFMTREAIPSLVFGRTVDEVRNGRAPELLFRFDGAANFQQWTEAPSVFSEARALGWSTAIIGWYMPYCRMFNEQVSACAWEPALSQISQEIPNEVPLARHAGLLLAKSVYYVPFAVRLRIGNPSAAQTQDIAKERANALHEFRSIREKALSWVVDEKFDFVFVHWPVPHSPGIFTCKTGVVSAEGAGNYMDNLCLADRVLGEVRTALEQARLWDQTTLLVSADHSLRDPKTELGYKGPSSPHVPFLMKVAGDNAAVRYERPFNTVASKGILLDVMKGKLRKNADIGAYLDKRSATGWR
jgi:hypothetical protein